MHARYYGKPVHSAGRPGKPSVARTQAIVSHTLRKKTSSSSNDAQELTVVEEGGDPASSDFGLDS